MENILYLLPGFGVLGLLFVVWKSAWVERQDAGTDKMKKIASHIAEGAMAFLKAEYKVLAIFVVCVSLLLAFTADSKASHPLVGVSFVLGSFCSALAGFIGMRVATKANVRTTNAARTSLGKALEVAFAGGSVMGMGVVGLGVLGLSVLFIVYSKMFGVSDQMSLNQVITVITGFSFGASSIALFARVGGGIYTKAAYVGGDLVGKVESGIPEDHPLNPATIADNVGDNVGDVAGMGADLFESYIAAIVGAMVIGITAQQGRLEAVVMPMVLAAIGILVSVAATYAVRTKEGGNPQTALNGGSTGAAIVMVILSWFIIDFFLDMARDAKHPVMFAGAAKSTLDLFMPLAAGLAAGVAVGFITDYYCSKGKPPVDSVVAQSATGPATNIIAGLGVGMRSTAAPVLCIAAAIYVADLYAGLYGI